MNPGELWKKVTSNPRYGELSPDEAMTLRKDFFSTHWAKDSRYLSLAPHEQTQFVQDFIHGPAPKKEEEQGYLSQMWDWGAGMVKDVYKAWKEGDVPAMTGIPQLAEGLAEQYKYPEGTMWKQPSLTASAVAAVPFIGPPTVEGIQAMGEGKPKTASAKFTQAGLVAAAPKVAGKARTALGRSRPLPRRQVTIRKGIEAETAPLTEGAPKPPLEAGRLLQAEIEPILRQQETMVSKATIERAALKKELAGKQAEFAVAQEAKLAAQERARFGEAADVFGPEKTSMELGTQLKASKEARAGAILERERRAWGKAHEVADLPENTKTFTKTEVFGSEEASLAGEPISVVSRGEAAQVAFEQKVMELLGASDEAAIPIKGPIPLEPVTAAIRADSSLWNRLEAIANAIPAAQREVSPAYKAIRDLMGGRKILSLREALDDMSALFNLGYTEFPEMAKASEGLARRVSPILRKHIDETVQGFHRGDEAMASLNRGRAYTKLRHEAFERGPGGVAEAAAKQFERGDVEGMILTRKPKWQLVKSTLQQTSKRDLPAIRRRVISSMMEQADYSPAKFAASYKSIRPEVRDMIFTPDQRALIERLGVPLERKTAPRGWAMQIAPLPSKLPELDLWTAVTDPNLTKIAGLLKKEPVQAVNELLAAGDVPIEKLKALDKLAPTIRPELAKTSIKLALDSGKQAPATYFAMGEETRSFLFGEAKANVDLLFRELGAAVSSKKGAIVNTIRSLFIYKHVPGGVHVRMGGPALIRAAEEAEAGAASPIPPPP